MRRLIRFFAISQKERQLFFEAVFTLLAARLQLRRRSVHEWFGPERLDRDHSPALNGSQRASAAAVHQAVARAQAALPLGISCLPQALAAKWMLDRRDLPGQVVIGFRKADADEAPGHAWVSSGDVMICGGRGEGFAPLLRYPVGPRANPS